tara:strand:- start:1395 stop:2237 length:843 start_codon:yes stop_codon:yes gene_type:complete
MISVVGIGNAASKIADLFSDTNNYEVYTLNDSVKRSSKRKFKLKNFDTPEEYEGNIPDLKNFFSDISTDIQVIVVGSSYSSNYVLGILEQIKDKNLDVFYIKPDSDLLTGTPKLIENTVFGVLQEYARSAMFGSLTIISNLEIEKSLDNIPIKRYYEAINNTIFSMIHYVNYFTHAEPEIGMVSKPLEINRIRSFGAIDPKNLEEKWFFELDTPRDVCYYICINQETLETDGTLHRRLVDILKNKPRNTFQRVSYAIYETPHQNDFGFCVAYTNVVQKNT